MSAANGHGTGTHRAMTNTRSAVLLRYHSGVTGHTGRIGHLVPSSPQGERGAAGVAMCGALLRPDLVESVTPGGGMPCLLCALHHANSAPAPANDLTSGHHHRERAARGSGGLPGMELAGDATR